MRKQPMVCDRDEKERDTYCGILPSRAPLANPYVPFQQYNPPTYPAKKGVVRGTLFPGLDLPFMGMINDEPLDDTPLHELQALGFAVQELGEYLDTHRDDREAFELFQNYAKLYREGKNAYEEKFGPLTMLSSANGGDYNWLKGPWPWEYEANRKEE